MTDHRRILVHYRDGEVTLSAQLFEDSFRTGKQFGNPARKGGDLTVKDAFAGRPRQVEAMRLAERVAQPYCQHVSLVTGRIDLRHENDVRAQCLGQGAHQLLKEFGARFGGDSRVDDAYQLGDVL